MDSSALSKCENAEGKAGCLRSQDPRNICYAVNRCCHMAPLASQTHKTRTTIVILSDTSKES